MIWLFLKILNDILLRIQKEKHTWLLFNGIQVTCLRPHRKPGTGQRPACRRQPRIRSDHRKSSLSVHSRPLLPMVCVILCPWSAGCEKAAALRQESSGDLFFMISAFRSERRQRSPPAPPCFASAPRPHASSAAGRLHQNPHIPLRRQAPSPTGILHLQRSIPG